MPKKQKRSSKKHVVSSKNPNIVWHQTSEEATLAKKPHYNGFACGYGAHGSKKHDRAKGKRMWQKEQQQQLGQKGASRGSFLLGTAVITCPITRRFLKESPVYPSHSKLYSWPNSSFRRAIRESAS